MIKFVEWLLDWRHLIAAALTAGFCAWIKLGDAASIALVLVVFVILVRGTVRAIYWLIGKQPKAPAAPNEDDDD